MKKLFLALTVICVSVACKKETSTTNSNTNGITNDTTKTTNQPTSGFGPNIKDIEGNSYKTVYIGTQQWMAENLKVSKYNDGTQIPNVTNREEWSNLTSGAWTYYDNDAVNNLKYGKLYNWFGISPTTNGNKNICPTGWHVPSDAEWTVLINYLGGESVAGGKMKEEGITSWNNPNIDGNNKSLFTGLPGGIRDDDGDFDDIGDDGNWWSSSEYNTESAWYNYLEVDGGDAEKSHNNKKDGISVRCLKN
jgi:uncharacterized protein (TIGR02145 family)